jgi:hypothetical protein
MIRSGQHVFSPVAHSHPLAELGLPSLWEDWESFDRAMIERCSELVVLRLHGWNDSKGVLAEIRIARDLGKPVRFVEPEDSECSSLSGGKKFVGQEVEWQSAALADKIVELAG